MSWTCPNCEREFPRPEQRHYCARVSLNSLFEGKSAEYDKPLFKKNSVQLWSGLFRIGQ